MPRTLAASRNSRVRTEPRSPFGASAGSLVEPASPREAQKTTTRAPASEARANVPPHASDSSSGCAKTPRMVRPVRFAAARGSRRSSGAGTTGLEHMTVYRFVFGSHAFKSETCEGPLADTAPIELEDPRQSGRHLFHVLEHEAGDALVHDLSHGAAIESGHRRAAGHRLNEHEPERLRLLNGIHQRARPAEQL